MCDSIPSEALFGSLVLSFWELIRAGLIAVTNTKQEMDLQSRVVFAPVLLNIILPPLGPEWSCSWPMCRTHPVPHPLSARIPPMAPAFRFHPDIWPRPSGPPAVRGKHLLDRPLCLLRLPQPPLHSSPPPLAEAEVSEHLHHGSSSRATSWPPAYAWPWRDGPHLVRLIFQHTRSQAELGVSPG